MEEWEMEDLIFCYFSICLFIYYFSILFSSFLIYQRYRELVFQNGDILLENRYILPFCIQPQMLAEIYWDLL